MNLEAPLTTFRIAEPLDLAQARPWLATPARLDSPALEVMTDLTQVKAAATQPSTPAAEAEQQMIYLGVRMLFVVSQMPAVEGLITAADIRGDRQMRLVHERRTRFDELTVADLMTPLAQLDAIGLDQLRGARVGNIIATLKRSGRHHLLVVEPAVTAGARRVRGVFSRSQVERQLGTAIDITQVARDFAEIERALAG
jgi:CBS domain containing-hemolysin-like protein